MLVTKLSVFWHTNRSLGKICLHNSNKMDIYVDKHSTQIVTKIVQGDQLMISKGSLKKFVEMD